MTKHIILPTNTSDLETIKRVLDYLYNNMHVEYNLEDFENEARFTSGGSHKIAFLDYFSIINRSNTKEIQFKLTAQFIYLYWDNIEIRNNLLILSWLFSSLPSSWNSVNKPEKPFYIICELFKIILENKDLDILEVEEKLKKFLSDDTNLINNTEVLNNEINEDLEEKLKKIVGYFKGVLANLGILSSDRKEFSHTKLEIIKQWIEELEKNNFDIKTLKKILIEIIGNNKNIVEVIENKNIINKNLKSELPSPKAYSKILYGAPGTGKSYTLNQEVKMYFDKNIERVTFYEGYTYGQFVGMYKPVTLNNNDIGYKYVPGPFMRQLLKAYKNPDKNFCLIIEEINRAEASKVFGSIFQLLDRNQNGESEYSISISEEQEKFLEETLVEDYSIFNKLKDRGLYLPNNLYIWATMNSADDGVHFLDTAFKRRWKFEYINLNANESKFGDNSRFLIGNYNEKDITWNDFRKTLNNILKEEITEDRLIAPFFISPNNFEESSENKKIVDKKIFIEKVLMYIFDDLLKHYPRLKIEIFNDNIKIFSDIYNTSSDENFLVTIFKKEFLEKILEV